MTVIKGMHLIAEASIGSKTMTFSTDAVPCVCGEQAVAAKARFERLN